MYELSLVELESELSAELPSRSLMSCRCRRRRRHGHGGRGGTSAAAGNGSVANANSTNQTISNPQTAVVTGVNSDGRGTQFNGALVAQLGLNHNSNDNTQFGTPVNFQG